MESMQQKQRMTAAGIHILLILVSITMLVPFVWMALTAFKTITESTSVDPFVIFPSSWKTDNFATVINNMNFPVLYVNTLLLILGRVVRTYGNHGWLCIWPSGVSGTKPDVLSCYVPDDGSRTDLYYPAVLNGQQSGRSGHNLCFDFPRYGNGIRNLPVKTDLHEPSERFGRSSKTGRLQYRSDLPVYHGSAYPFRYGISGHFYCSICI